MKNKKSSSADERLKAERKLLSAAKRKLPELKVLLAATWDPCSISICAAGVTVFVDGVLTKTPYRLDYTQAARLAESLGRKLPMANDYSLAEVFAGNGTDEINRPRIGFAP